MACRFPSKSSFAATLDIEPNVKRHVSTAIITQVRGAEPCGAHTAETPVQIWHLPLRQVQDVKTIVSICHRGQITEWGKIKKRTRLINLKKDAEIAVQLRQAVVEGCQTY